MTGGSINHVVCFHLFVHSLWRKTCPDKLCNQNGEVFLPLFKSSGQVNIIIGDTFYHLEPFREYGSRFYFNRFSWFTTCNKVLQLCFDYLSR